MLRDACRSARSRRWAGLAVLLLWSLAACSLHENLRPPEPPGAPLTQLTVATFNIRHGCGVADWGNTSSAFFRGCRKELEAVAAAIAATGADVVALQEVNDGQARALAGRLRLNYAYAPHNAGGYGSWWGNAVLSRFPIAASGVEAVGGTGGHSRSLVHATLDVQGRPLTVFSIHTDHRQRGEAAIRRILALARARPAPVLYAGDFNMTPLDARVRLLTEEGGLVDTAAAGNADGLTTFPGLGRIDYVFVPRERFAVLEARLVDAAHHQSSDHRAYVTRLRLLP
jgi:endonuclease/exonuclease/phosphatase family metal-dependent hydrolase